MLRGSDFRLSWKGRDVPHEDFFRDHGRNARVGLLAPDGTEGIGAGLLALAYVTAFYDGFRKEGGEFFAYPDYFSFQHRDRPASYCSFDFWPDKDVPIPDDGNATLAAIADRAINVLLVPDNQPSERRYDAVQIERTRRTLSRCFAYSRSGDVADADLVIHCTVEPFRTYAAKVVRSVDAPLPEWLVDLKGPAVAQSFREVQIDDALPRL